MPSKFIKDEILVNHMEALKILISYNLNACVTTCKFMECVIRAFEASGSTKIDLPIIALELMSSFDVLETKKEGKFHRLYGHSVAGEKFLLLTKSN